MAKGFAWQEEDAGFSPWGQPGAAEGRVSTHAQLVQTACGTTILGGSIPPRLHHIGLSLILPDPHSRDPSQGPTVLRSTRDRARGRLRPGRAPPAGEQTTQKLGLRIPIPPARQSRADRGWSQAPWVTLGEPFLSLGLSVPSEPHQHFSATTPPCPPCLRGGLASGLASPRAPLPEPPEASAHPREARASIKEPHSALRRPASPRGCQTPTLPSLPAAPLLGSSCQEGENVLIPLEARPHAHLFQT